MPSSYMELAIQLGAKLKDFEQEIPNTMQGLTLMGEATHHDGALSAKTKELIAMAISISECCQGSLALHAQACVKFGVTRAEFEEMLQVAIHMGDNSAQITAAEALAAYEEFGGEKTPE